MIITVVVLLPLLVVLGLAFAAIRHKNWGGLAVLTLGLGAMLGLLLFTGFVTVRVRAQEQIKVARMSGLRDQALQIATEAVNTAPSPPPVPPAYLSAAARAEVASDEELAAVASAPPKIELEEVATEAEVKGEASEDETADKAANGKSKRPDWIDAHLGDNQKLIVSGPFTTKDSCESDTQNQITEWVWSRHRNQWPNSAGPFPDFWLDVSEVVQSQHEEIRDTSVGEVHLVYTLAEVAPEVDARMSKLLADAAAEVGRKRGVRTVTFAGAGVLSLVALTHVVLRSGGRKPKNGAK